MAEEKVTCVYKRHKPQLFCNIPLLLEFNFASNRINANSSKNNTPLFYIKVILEAVSETWSASLTQWSNSEVPVGHT